MDTLKVKEYLIKDKYTKKIFRGVIPIDLLKIEYLNGPGGFIINTGISGTPGEHWFALYVPKSGPIEYFDSYGFKPINKEVYFFAKANKKPLIHNRYKIQGNNSLNCGKFSIFYLYLRARGFPLRKIIQFFNKNKYINDIIITKLFNKIKLIF